MLVIKVVKLQKILNYNSNFFSVAEIESYVVFSKCHFSFKVKSLRSPRTLSASEHFISRSTENSFWETPLVNSLSVKRKAFPHPL